MSGYERLAMTETIYLRCRVGIQWYGIDVNHVIEVLNFMMLTELPGATADILGMMTLRNMVMPVLDLRLRFGLSAALYRETPIVAVSVLQSPLGLIVDEVDELTTVAEQQFAPYEGEVSRYITGIARLSNSLLLLLDLTQFSTATVAVRD